MSEPTKRDDPAKRGFRAGVIVGIFAVGFAYAYFIVLGMAMNPTGMANADMSFEMMGSIAIVFAVPGLFVIAIFGFIGSVMEKGSARRLEERRLREPQPTLTVPAPKRRWPVLQLLAFGAFAIFAAVTWYFPFRGNFSLSESMAIRRVIGNDTRTKDEPILEINKSTDGAAEVVIGVTQIPGNEGKCRIALLQKRKGGWKIQTVSQPTARAAK